MWSFLTKALEVGDRTAERHRERTESRHDKHAVQNNAKDIKDISQHFRRVEASVKKTDHANPAEVSTTKAEVSAVKNHVESKFFDERERYEPRLSKTTKAETIDILPAINDGDS